MSPTFTRQKDGAVTVDGWTLQIEIDPGFLIDADPAFLVTDGRRVQIHVANGDAIYEGDTFPAPYGGPVWRGVLVQSDGPLK